MQYALLGVLLGWSVSGLFFLFKRWPRQHWVTRTSDGQVTLLIVLAGPAVWLVVIGAIIWWMLGRVGR